MKTSLSITIFLGFITFSGFSQSFVDTLISDIQNNARVSIIKRDLLTLKDNRHYVSIYETDYDFDSKTLNCQFTCEKNWYSLIGHFKNDTIFTAEILRRIEDSDITVYKSEYKFLDTSSATNYLMTHNLFYSANSRLSDFFSQRFERFGYACGFVGQITESMTDCLSLIKAKDRVSFISLATSVNPTDRAYGVFGLYILKRTGCKLSDAEEKIIKLNQNSKAEAYSCSGCSYGSQSLSSLLDSKNLRWYFSWYKRAGKLY